MFPRGHTITAELTIPKGGAEGVVTCAGAFSAGWSLYIKDNKPHFRYTGFEIADITIPGTVAIPEGNVTLKTEFRPDGSKEGGGTVTMSVNGKPVGEGKIKGHLLPARAGAVRSRTRLDHFCRSSLQGQRQFRVHR